MAGAAAGLAGSTVGAGVGVAGVYPYDVAQSRIRKVEELARMNEYPLRLTMEPEDD